MREKLKQYIKRRGDVVHRSRIVVAGPPAAYPVTKEDLQKVIRFLMALVGATEAALEREHAPA